MQVESRNNGEEKLLGIFGTDQRWVRRMGHSVRDDGFQVALGIHWDEALDFAADQNPDLLILTGQLYGEDRIIPLVNRIREFSSLPLIVVGHSSSYEDDLERVLSAGADLYLEKIEVGSKELSARINALLRRSRIQSQTPGQPPFTNGDLTVDFRQHLVMISDQFIDVTRTEYRLLSELALKVGRTFTCDDLSSRVWGEGYEDDHILRVNIARLRKKLGEDSLNPKYIRTRYGVGYYMPNLNHLEGETSENPGSR